VWKGPIQTSAQRNFNFCDSDGLIWASENGQFFALNANDTTNVPPRAGAWTPNQQVGAIAASVDNDGYRLYDRWSPQSTSVDVPLAAMPATMEIYDLNLWSNDLHTANIIVQNGSNTVWSQTGQFTGRVSVAVSGQFNEGQNILTLTQNDFLGGQVLITFPYAFNHIISAAGDVNVVVSPAGNIVVTNGANAAFTFTPAQYYHIANVEVDAASVGTNSSYTLLNVTQDHTLQAYSAANLATNNVPQWWLASFGLTTPTWDAAALADQDGDGMVTWQEYRAGTDPTSSISVLRVTSVTPTGANFVVSFPTVAGKLYDVQWANDVNSGSWSNLVSSFPGTGGTASVTDTNALLQPQRFYRIKLITP